MKRTFIAALAFLALASCGEKKTAEATTENKGTTESEVVAEGPTEEIVTPNGDYVYVDVLYVISKSDIVNTEGKKLEDKGKALEEKGKKLEEKFAKGEQGIQYEMQQLNEKAQKVLITQRDYQTRAEELQKSMAYLQAQAQKELPAFQKEMGEFQEEMTVFNNRVQDYIVRAVQNINADKKYKMVINTASLLDYDKSLDISNAVLNKMNELYKAEKKSTPSDKKK